MKEIKHRVKLVKCNCVVCDSYIGEFYPSATRKTCSPKCKAILNGINVKGEKNPNYHNGKLHEKFCKVCGKSIDLRAMFCPKHKNTFYTPNMKGDHHTIKTKKIIGKKSAAKFTKEFIKRVYHDRHIGNKKITNNGYILIKSYDHPNRNKADDMMEHRLIIENNIKRYLKRSEIVHHIDFNRKNNDISNLYLYKNRS